MPSPTFTKLKQAVTGTITTAVVVGDKAFRAASPVVRKAAEGVVSRVTNRRAASTVPAEAGSGPSTPLPVEPESPVSPATVARNIGQPRPTVKPAAPIVSDPEDSPGGKLPPRH